MHIIIVGGGLLGATLALALKNLTAGKILISLIESMPSSHLTQQTRERTLALAHGTVKQLQRHAIWPLFVPYANAITKVNISAIDHNISAQLTAAEFHIDALGYAINSSKVQQQLLAQLSAAENIALYQPDSVITVTRTAKEINVLLASGKKLSASLLIAADGTYSTTARACNMSITRAHLSSTIITAIITTTTAPEQCAYEILMDEGPLALIPLGANKHALIWSVLPHYRQILVEESDTQLCSRLAAVLEADLGKIRAICDRQSHPIEQSLATRLITHRVVLVGNAAQTLHPIAAQGFNLGVRDALTLANKLAIAFQQKGDLGEYSLLSHYEQQRLRDREETLQVVARLLQLSTISPTRFTSVLTHIGCTLFNSAAPLKHHFAQWALGWRPTQ